MGNGRGGPDGTGGERKDGDGKDGSGKDGKGGSGNGGGPTPDRLKYPYTVELTGIDDADIARTARALSDLFREKDRPPATRLGLRRRMSDDREKLRRYLRSEGYYAVRIDAARFRSKSKNSPFDGKPAQGRVWRTVYRGRTVFDVDAEDARPRREHAHA